MVMVRRQGWEGGMRRWRGRRSSEGGVGGLWADRGCWRVWQRVAARVFALASFELELELTLGGLQRAVGDEAKPNEGGAAEVHRRDSAVRADDRLGGPWRSAVSSPARSAWPPPAKTSRRVEKENRDLDLAWLAGLTSLRLVCKSNTLFFFSLRGASGNSDLARWWGTAAERCTRDARAIVHDRASCMGVRNGGASDAASQRNAPARARRAQSVHSNPSAGVCRASARTAPHRTALQLHAAASPSQTHRILRRILRTMRSMHRRHCVPAGSTDRRRCWQVALSAQRASLVSEAGSRVAGAHASRPFGGARASPVARSDTSLFFFPSPSNVAFALPRSFARISALADRR